jgi:hypothetical protein
VTRLTVTKPQFAPPWVVFLGVVHSALKWPILSQFQHGMSHVSLPRLGYALLKGF